MNKQNRGNLKKAIDYLAMACDISNDCLDYERDALSNMEGTSLEYTERYSDIEESCDYLDEAIEHIESAMDSLHSAIEK